MTPRPEELAGLMPGGRRATTVEALHGDGSARRFFRVRSDAGSFVLLAGPDPAENAAYVRVGRHLAERGVRVPRIHGVDPARGWILLEDLGDRNLYAALRNASGAEGKLALYEPVVELLVRMQAAGSRGFDLAVGFAPAPYGPALMVEGEGLYFAREFAEGVLGLRPDAALRPDLEALARVGARAPATYFLHRDFQSRNVHLTPGGPALIDFQGARPGPLAYDAAALLLDPYAGLPAPVRERLLAAYLAGLGRAGLEPRSFEDAWYAVGSFRLLQALGAFGKLGGRLGKPGFLEHAGTALGLLLDHLGERGRREVPRLHALASRCRDAWARRAARP